MTKRKNIPLCKYRDAQLYISNARECIFLAEEYEREETGLGTFLSSDVWYEEALKWIMRALYLNPNICDYL